METKPTSMRGYAKRRGVSVEAVSKAVAAGRLRESIVSVGGVPKIADVELADREWEANTRQRVDGPRQPPQAQGRSEADVPDYMVSRARRESALADMAEIEVLEKKGALVPVDQARSDVIEIFTVVKTKLLGVPSRLAQQLPHVAAAVVPVLDTFIREALEELSNDRESDDRHGDEATA